MYTKCAQRYISLFTLRVVLAAAIIRHSKQVWCGTVANIGACTTWTVETLASGAPRPTHPAGGIWARCPETTLALGPLGGRLFYQFYHVLLHT